MSRTTKHTDMGWPGIQALWSYDSLSEPLLSSELARLSDVKSIGDTDCVTFQPCPDPAERNQDRYVVHDWELANGSWRFCGIFDGHTGHDTVDYTAVTLPGIIRTNLAQAVFLAAGDAPNPSAVNEVLIESIASFDNALTEQLLRLFPDPESIEKLSDDELRAIINDTECGGTNLAIVTRCMRGSTVLVSLLDTSKSNLWVASLGDCQAVLGTKDPDGTWEASILSSYHNGADKGETERIRREHPGEAECVLDDRVLGGIAVTRVGDHLFKLPTVYTERVFMNARPGLTFSRRIDDFLRRNLTPPYLSNRADIRHVDLKVLGVTDANLIMCSDGLIDLYEVLDLPLDTLAQLWVQRLADDREAKEGHDNLALCLLRDALGGADHEKVSRMMTVEMCFRWMDDTTILVEKL